jgi:hypothetical protein
LAVGPATQLPDVDEYLGCGDTRSRQPFHGDGISCKIIAGYKYFWNKKSSAAKSGHDASTAAFGAPDPGKPAWNTNGSRMI